MLHRAHELHCGHTIGQLIIHDLRNRQRLDAVFEGLLQAVRKALTGAHTFVVELFGLAVAHALKLRNRAGNAERSHFLHQGRCGFTVGTDTDLHRHKLLTEGLVRALFKNVGDVNGHAARGTVGVHNGIVRQKMRGPEALGNTFGKRVGKFL